LLNEIVLHAAADAANQADILASEDLHTSGAYGKRPIAIVAAEGARLIDAEGRSYIDAVGGHGVCLLGHRHPAILEAITRQYGRVITCPEIFYNDQRARLYESLQAHLAPRFGRYFLCNSGAEAVEAAFKLSRALTQRPGIVAMQGCFHGRTLGALSATWRPKYREPFVPLVPGFEHVPFNDLETAQATVDDSTAAVIVELIQGEGGINPIDDEFLRGLRSLCSERGALLIFDEIQSGLGRTGRWFCYEHHEVVPDLICLGKGIAGGLPMGALVWRSDLGTFPPHSHGSTFGGNPLVCAAANATLQVLEDEKLPERSADIGERFLDSLRSVEHPLIREVRGRGLMIGIDLRRRATPVLQAMAENGVLALPAGTTVVRLLPPLSIPERDLERMRTTFMEALEEVYGD
jgi:acetylornithine/LysW-gamma-L-lysine aminotransferase